MPLPITREQYMIRKNATKITSGQSKTEQSKKNQCDINRIMARAKKSGIMPDLQGRQILYQDFSNIPEYQESLNRVIKMENEFMSLPAEVRNKFKNDPSKLLEFVNNPENEEEAVKLQLLPKPVITSEKLETPEGNFWVVKKNGVETARHPVENKQTP